jgi:hypothetical protein
VTPFHAGFRSLYRDGPLIDAVSELLGERAVLFKDKINFKMPGGAGFKVHQDAQAGWHLYARFFISALVSIDRSTPDNGCLQMAPGWHDKGLIGEEWKPLDEASTSQMRFVSLPTEPGERRARSTESHGRGQDYLWPSAAACGLRPLASGRMAGRNA